LFLKKIPSILTKSVKDVTWHLSRMENAIYLSFDDGPDPDSTPALLELLERHAVKATFFCLGKPAERHPELVEQIRAMGHTVAAHGYEHLDGWRTKNERYFENARRSMQLLETKLFRPPYGRISPSQLKVLAKECRVVLWDVMPGDFDEGISSDTCVLNMNRRVQAGSIVVLHDRSDMREKLHSVLEECLPLLKERFDCLSIEIS